MNAIPHGARALEFDVDEKNKIAKLVWSYMYDSTTYSSARGNVQRLANSNTLVNFGLIQNDSISFLVIDSLGKRIFQVNNLRSNPILNYTSLPWKFNRPELSCFDSLGVRYLRTTQNYK